MGLATLPTTTGAIGAHWCPLACPTLLALLAMQTPLARWLVAPRLAAPLLAPRVAPRLAAPPTAAPRHGVAWADRDPGGLDDHCERTWPKLVLLPLMLQLILMRFRLMLLLLPAVLD